MISIQAKGLEVVYCNTLALALNDFQVSGSVICLIGRNGAGKSTLIKSILGLAPIKSGSIEVLSDKGICLKPEEDMIFSPENGAVFADISVEAYLRLWCRLKCPSEYFYKTEGAGILERMRISELLPKLGRELSKGQRRRVQVAIGLIIGAKLLLLDEPFDGFDVSLTQEFIQLIGDFRSNTSFILSSHRMGIVERVADQVVLLDNGRVVSAGTVSNVVRNISNAESGNLSDALGTYLAEKTSQMD